MTTTELTYEETIDAWRAQAEATLRAEDGWLTLAGLFWLQEGRIALAATPRTRSCCPRQPPR